MLEIWRGLFYDKTAARSFLKAFFMMIGGTLIAKGIPALVPYAEWGVLFLGCASIIPVGQPNHGEPPKPKEG